MSSSPVEAEKTRRFLCWDPSSSLTVREEMRGMMRTGEETRTRSFPGRDISSAGGESEVDDVGSGELLEELSALCLEYPHPEMDGVRRDE